jgi:hypothetical protein
MVPMTPYLALVVVTFAAFILTLGVVWARGALADLRAKR